MSRIKFKSNGGKNLSFGHLDKAGMLPTIDDLHSRIHNGDVFSISRQVSSLADSASSLLQITTPADYGIHLKEAMIWVSDSPCLYEIVESPTLTDGTSEVSSHNRNRQSSLTALTKVYHDPTGISGGTVIESVNFGTGAGPAAVFSGDFILRLEWLLKQEKNYLIRLTNNSGSSIDVSFNIDWYELSD